MTLRILFVCTGNTCRSPLAEVVARRVLKDEEVDGVEVRSAGTFAVDGARASAASQEAARANGLDLEAFQSRRLGRAEVEEADLILVMEPAHRSGVLGIDPRADTKTLLLGELGGASGRAAVVPDPFGDSTESYHRTFSRIEELIRAGLERIRELARDKKTRRA